MTQFSLDFDEIIQVVHGLGSKDFYQSMTSHEDHTRWHDVYHKVIGKKIAYIKIQIDSGNTVIISFKKR